MIRKLTIINLQKDGQSLYNYQHVILLFLHRLVVHLGHSCRGCNNGNYTNSAGTAMGTCSADVSASFECLQLMYWLCKNPETGLSQEPSEAAADGCRHCTVIVAICATSCNYCDIAPSNIVVKNNYTIIYLV